jgi:hypothetical protein
MPIYEDSESYHPRLYYGPLSERPDTGVRGRLWLDSDTGRLYFDNGEIPGTWLEIAGSSSSLADVGIFTPELFGGKKSHETGGSTNQLDAFQDAVDAAWQYAEYAPPLDNGSGDLWHGGQVFISPGIWIVDGIQLRPQVLLQGGGLSTELRRPTGAGAATAILRTYEWETNGGVNFDSYIYNFGVRDMTINGMHGGGTSDGYTTDTANGSNGGGGIYIASSDSFTIDNVAIVRCRGAGLWTHGASVSSSYGLTRYGGQNRLQNFVVGDCYGLGTEIEAAGYKGASVLIGGSTDQNITNFQIWFNDDANPPDEGCALAIAAGGHKISDFHIWGIGFETGVKVYSVNNQIRNFTVESMQQENALAFDVQGADNQIHGHIYHFDGATTMHGVKFSGSWQRNDVRVIVNQLTGKVVEFASNSGTGSSIWFRAWRVSTTASPITYTAPVTDVPAEVDIDARWNFTGGATKGQLLVQSIDAAGDWRANGDLKWQANGRGPVIKSPDGTSYRIVVANGGALSASAI